MKKTTLLLIVLFTIVYTVLSQDNTIKKSTILFTREDIATDFNYDKYKSDGVFWGHMPYEKIHDDWLMNQWAAKVSQHTSEDKYFFGRGELDWGWKWMIDYMDDPGSYWAMNLDSSYIQWANETYNGHFHNWQSHHGPDFLNWLKYQVDRMLMAPITHIMLDSQTSATRTLHWLGGDFSIYAMQGFRTYLADKYSSEELSSNGIDDIETFNYRNFLLDKGFTLESFKNEALSIDGDIPLYDDFVYFNRQALNDVMEELFDYIDTKKPGIDIGLTTNLVEPRGYVFSDRTSYLAGEFYHEFNPAVSPPYMPILHFKAAEYLDKTLLFFPYPDAFQDLQRRNSPKQALGWIAQAYAMGSVFIVPGDVWVGWSGTWDPGWENHAFLYEFIHDNSHLLDDYEAVSNVALCYSVYASLLEPSMNGSATANSSLEYLIKENVSFDLQIFGDPDRPFSPTLDQLDHYEVIVTDNDMRYLTPKQDLVLDSVDSRIVAINNSNEIMSRLSWKIDVLENGVLRNNLISALPRMSSKPDANYVLHLLNRQYNGYKDIAQVHHDISVRLPQSVFPNTITGAKLHLPDESTIDLDLVIDDSKNIVIEIGTFDNFWGIVELLHSESASSIEAPMYSTEIVLYSNPASDVLRFKNTSGYLISSVEIFDMKGKSLGERKLVSNSIDVSSLLSGIYIIKIEIQGDVVIKQFVV